MAAIPPGVNLPELTTGVSKVTYEALDAYLKDATCKVKVETRNHRRPRGKGGAARK